MTKIELRTDANSGDEGGSLDVWTQTDRLFQDLEDRFYSGIAGPWVGIANFGRSGPSPPSLDVADRGAQYELRVDLPGVSKDQVDVRVIGNTVQLHAEGAEEKEEAGKNFLRRERSWAGYERSVELPEQLRAEGVSAKLENGVLTVTVPKANPVTERKVPVQ